MELNSANSHSKTWAPWSTRLKIQKSTKNNKKVNSNVEHIKYSSGNSTEKKKVNEQVETW